MVSTLKGFFEPGMSLQHLRSWESHIFFFITFASAFRRKGATMDKNRIEGAKHEIKGAVKEVVGKVTGNTGKQIAGNVEKNAGKVEKEIGKATDKARKNASR